MSAALIKMCSLQPLADPVAKYQWCLMINLMNKCLKRKAEMKPSDSAEVGTRVSDAMQKPGTFSSSTVLYGIEIQKYGKQLSCRTCSLGKLPSPGSLADE